MSLVIKTDDPRRAPNASGKSGEGYDRCPEDGCMEVDQSHHLGGVDNHGEEHHMWSMFSADRRNGGCGATWTRTTKQGTEYDHKRGIDTQRFTQSAEVGRVFSMSTKAYEEGWERIYGKR